MRTLIQEVIADIDPQAAEIVLVVHWIGGVHSEIRLPRRRRGATQRHLRRHHCCVRTLALIANDDLIAGILNRNSLVTGNGNRWTRERVTSAANLPLHPGVQSRPRWHRAVAEPQHGSASSQDRTKDAQAGGGSGEIAAVHPLPDGPLGPWPHRSRRPQHVPSPSEPGRTQNTPRDHPDQQSLFSSIT